MKKIYLSKKKRDTDAEEREKIGERLRTKRHLKNLTQEEVAKLIGLTTTAYSKIERGESGVNMDRLKQLGKVLDIDIMTLVDNVPPSKTTLHALVSNLTSMTKNIEKISAWIVSEKPQIYRIADAGTVVSGQEFNINKENKPKEEKKAEKIEKKEPARAKRKYKRHKTTTKRVGRPRKKPGENIETEGV